MARRSCPSEPAGILALPDIARNSRGTAIATLRFVISSPITTAYSMALRRWRCSIDAGSDMTARYPITIGDRTSVLDNVRVFVLTCRR